MHSVEELEISGYGGRRVPNTFFRQEPDAGHLGVFFPGYSYRCNEPLLWYPTRLLLSLGADVLWVEYPYDRLPEFGNSDERVQRAWLFEDSMAALDSARKARRFRRTTLVGKSLGTIALARALGSGPTTEDVRGVWLTPVLTDHDLRRVLEEARVPSLVVIGSADHYYDQTFVEQLRRKPSTEVLVVQGGDHVLETKEGTVRSIDILRTVVESIGRFVGE